MSKSSQRFSELSPLGIECSTYLTKLAIDFFSPHSSKKYCDLIGKTKLSGSITLFDTNDFLNYLGKINFFEQPLRHLFQVAALLRQLARGNVLQEIGPPKPVVGPKYTFFRELTTTQRRGWCWLSEALGPEYVYRLFSSHIFHITGRNQKGDAVAGTGIAISGHWILTCAHVLDDMEVNEIQHFGGFETSVIAKHTHPEIDVGLLQIDTAVNTLPDLSFSSPLINEPLYSLGFPRIPMSREATPVMHRGEVTAPSIVSFQGHQLFLFSAISRPGNSGGPIISAAGRIIGIVSQELSDNSRYSGLPFYAGVPTLEIKRAIDQFDVGVVLPVEDYS